MKAVKYILTGILFGIIMTKSEAVSWYRIQEMFRFQSFFMYGIIGSAVITGMVMVAVIKKYRFSDLKGQPIQFHTKDKRWKNTWAGGSIFGMGWALTGALSGAHFRSAWAGLYGHDYRNRRSPGGNIYLRSVAGPSASVMIIAY